MGVGTQPTARRTVLAESGDVSDFSCDLGKIRLVAGLEFLALSRDPRLVATVSFHHRIVVYDWTYIKCKLHGYLGTYRLVLLLMKQPDLWIDSLTRLEVEKLGQVHYYYYTAALKHDVRFTSTTKRCGLLKTPN